MRLVACSLPGGGVSGLKREERHDPLYCCLTVVVQLPQLIRVGDLFMLRMLSASVDFEGLPLFRRLDMHEE